MEHKKKRTTTSEGRKLDRTREAENGPGWKLLTRKSNRRLSVFLPIPPPPDDCLAMGGMGGSLSALKKNQTIA